MTGIFGVSSSAYYKRAKKEESGGKQEGDEELTGLIRLIQEQHHYRYGSPRVREALRRDYGKRVSRKKVARRGQRGPFPARPAQGRGRLFNSHKSSAIMPETGQEGRKRE
jgi:hypothetical protein